MDSNLSVVKKGKADEGSSNGVTLAQVIEHLELLGNNSAAQKPAPSPQNGTTGQQEGPSGGRSDVNGMESNLIMTVPFASKVPKVTYPWEKPPLFRGTVDTFARWTQDFVEYSKSYLFYHVLSKRIELDVSDPYTARETARKSGISELNFNRTILARWALRSASKDNAYMKIVDSVGVPYRAWEEIRCKFRVNTPARRSALMKRFVNASLRGAEDPLRFLGRLDDLNLQLHDLEMGFSESDVLDHFVSNLSDDYAVQVAVLTLTGPEELDRTRVIISVRSRYRTLHAKDQALHAKPKPRKYKGKTGDTTKNSIKNDGKVRCFSCHRLGHYAIKCPNKVCSLCGAADHVAKACTDLPDPASSTLAEIPPVNGSFCGVSTREFLRLRIGNSAGAPTETPGNTGGTCNAVCSSVFVDSQATDASLMAELPMGIRQQAGVRMSRVNKVSIVLIPIWHNELS